MTANANATAERRASDRRVDVSPFLRDVLLTGVTTVVTILSLVLVTRWLARGLGPEGFGAYGLSRRVVSAVAAMSPIGVALTRYLAAETSASRRRALLAAAILAVMVPLGALLVIGIGAAGSWTEVVFHESRYRELWVATVLLTAGTVLYSVPYAWYRGTGRMRTANLWQLGAVAVGPALIAGWLASRGALETIVLLNAALLGLLAVPSMIGGVAGLRDASVRNEIRPSLGALLRYGVPRVPGGIAFGWLLAIGPLLAPYFATLREAGYLVAGQSILRVVEGAATAFGLVALPKLAALQAQRQTAFIRDRVADLVAMAVHLGLFATAHLLLWSRVIVTVWLGEEYDAALPLIRVVLAGVVPYVIYVLLRSVIDALDERAINSRNVFVAFGATVVASIGFAVLGMNVVGLAAGGTIGLLVLGGLTVEHLRRSVAFDSGQLKLPMALLLNALLLAVGLGASAAARQWWSGGALLGVGAGSEIVLFAGYVLLLRAASVRWVQQVERRLFTASHP